MLPYNATSMHKAEDKTEAAFAIKQENFSSPNLQKTDIPSNLDVSSMY